MLWRFYCHIWYYSEWWLDAYARRPFTFITHDYAHHHPIPAAFILAASFAALCFLSYQFPILAVALAALWGFILGHILWGGHKIGEQEAPPVINP